MTDRVQNLTVILDGDYRDDDVQTIIDAIQMIKGVQKVEPGDPLTVDDYLARQRVGIDLRSKVVEAMNVFLADKT